jgi:hypothetical protein
LQLSVVPRGARIVLADIGAHLTAASEQIHFAEVSPSILGAPSPAILRRQACKFLYVDKSSRYALNAGEGARAPSNKISFQANGPGSQ